MHKYAFTASTPSLPLPVRWQSFICPDHFMAMFLPKASYNFSGTMLIWPFHSSVTEALTVFDTETTLPSSNISLIGTQDMAVLRFSSSSLNLLSLPISFDYFFPHMSVWALSILPFLVLGCSHALSLGKLNYPDGFSFHLYLYEFQTCISGLF